MQFKCRCCHAQSNGRHNLAVALLSNSKPYAGKLNPWALAKKNGFSNPHAAAQFMLDLFLQQGRGNSAKDTLLTMISNASDAGQDPETVLRQFTHRVVTQAEFHLT